MLKRLFETLFAKDPAIDAGRALYSAAVEQARSEALYVDFAVPDTVEGRFEQVALHVYLIMRRLKGEAAAKQVSQCLFDAMFQNMDDSLREMGVGVDMVGKKIRKLAENFYGRIAVYEKALADDAPDEALVSALSRNVYGREDERAAAPFAKYVRKVEADLAAQPAARITGGIVVFPTPVLAS